MGGEGKCLGLGVDGNSKEWSACDMKAERWLFQKQKKGSWGGEEATGEDSRGGSGK